MVRRTRSKTEERLRLIKAAREFGFSDAEILAEVLRGEYGATHRRSLIVEWGGLLGMEVSAALRLAQSIGLIPTSHPPKKIGRKEKLPDKVPETSSE